MNPVLARLSTVIWVLSSMAVLGCAGPRPALPPSPVVAAGQAPAPSVPKRMEAVAPPPAAGGTAGDATGTWDWIFRGATQQGDLRIEQEEWHLQQEGARLSGFFLRQVMMLSSDNRPFRCNGLLAFTSQTRVRVVGDVQDGKLQLREVDADVEKNPCDDGARPLTTYTGRISGDSLTLQFPPSGQQHLVRRTAASRMASLGDARAAARDEGTLQLAGTWDWQFRAVDGDGDLHVEREEWHLTENGASAAGATVGEVSGYYERSLERRRGAGVFACNGSSVIQTTTRYTVKGHRFGNKITLSEVDYQTTPGPCENGGRRLDQYQGMLHPEGTLVLTWASGSQTLSRRAP